MDRRKVKASPLFTLLISPETPGPYMVKKVLNDLLYYDIRQNDLGYSSWKKNTAGIHC